MLIYTHTQEWYDFAEHMLFMGSSEFPDENEVCTLCMFWPSFHHLNFLGSSAHLDYQFSQFLLPSHIFLFVVLNESIPIIAVYSGNIVGTTDSSVIINTKLCLVTEVTLSLISWETLCWALNASMRLPFVVVEYYGASLNSVVSLLLSNEIWFCRCGTVGILYNTRLIAIAMIFQTYLYSMIKVMNLTLLRPSFLVESLCCTLPLALSLFLYYTLLIFPGKQKFCSVFSVLFSLILVFYSLCSILVCFIDFWLNNPYSSCKST